MPVVIALLNSYAGLADAAMGFVLMNKIQIITGSLDGTSGFLLSLLMCRAMNRSAMNVLFGAFGKVSEDEAAAGRGGQGHRAQHHARGDGRASSRPRASVIIVPGYGMAVAQAQHARRRAGATSCRKRGIDVKYAIHPVAGRMPGHMNVLLAEANVPYDQLYEMEQINPYFPEADIVLVVGANDVTNPAAQEQQEQPALRHADPRGRPRQVDHRAEAQHAARLRRRGQRPLLQREVHDAVRRRQGQPHQAVPGVQILKDMPRRSKNSRAVTLGLVQMRCGDEPADNLDKAVERIRRAARDGADVVCLQELFRSRYFCQTEDVARFRLAEPIPGPTTRGARQDRPGAEGGDRRLALREARATGSITTPRSCSTPTDGSPGSTARCTSPTIPLYYEKFYFTPGDLGFRSFATRHGSIGTLVCWDQWFPEAARLTALAGAEILFYPTAIGWLDGETADVNEAQHDAWETVAARATRSPTACSSRR